MLGRQIDDDEPVAAGGFRILQETRHAIAIDRIVIAHQHDRRGIVLVAEAPQRRQNLRQIRARFERTQRRGLDRRAVRHRIGERHADLDQIGAGLGQLRQQLLEGGAVRIAAGEIGHQPGAALFAQLLEACPDATHSLAPSMPAPEGMSLSPRPDKLITSRLSAGSLGARFIASATACADSSAGMMPSRRVSNWKATSASLSVIGTYSTRFWSNSQACSGPMPGESSPADIEWVSWIWPYES